MWMKVAFLLSPWAGGCFIWRVVYLWSHCRLTRRHICICAYISREGFRQKKPLRHLSGHAGDSNTSGSTSAGEKRGNMNQEVQTEWCIERAGHNIASQPLWISFFGELPMEAGKKCVDSDGRGGWHATKLPEKDERPGRKPERGN